MKYLVSAAEMRRYDNNTIEKIGIPALVLMERAALAAAERIVEHCGRVKGKKHVLILAGVGNNGGDGLAVARLLNESGLLIESVVQAETGHLAESEPAVETEDCREPRAFVQSGYSVEVWCVGNTQKVSEQWKRQREILKHYPVQFVDNPTRDEYTVLVDALFGVGLSRTVEGEYFRAIERFNRLEGWKLALDLPSGIDSDTGKVWGAAVRADETVTFGFAKRGLVLYPGCEYAGALHIAQIGITRMSFFGEKPEMFAYDEAVAELLPKRNPAGNKGTFGKVLLLAGSIHMAGAAILAAKAAYRAGAGMVKVISAAENRIIIQQAVPEALFDIYENLAQSIGWADVLVVGPGLGQDMVAYEGLQLLLQSSKKPMVVDADGLNLLCKHEELASMLAEAGASGREIILTPHVGELARLAGKILEENGYTVAFCKENLPKVACDLAEALHATVVAKDARTFICAEDKPVCVNLSGNCGMATAGSGDVLAGIIGSLLAQGMAVYEAACVGVYIHGKAGDAAVGQYGEHGCMAGDIASALNKINN